MGPAFWSNSNGHCLIEPPLSADVIVIGSGMAGISAARELRKHGLSVVVLEGRDRIGGRLHTNWSLDDRVGVDMGGAWIHGAGAGALQNPVYSLAEKYGLPLCPTDYDDVTVFGPSGVRLECPELKARGCLYARFEAFLHELDAGALEAESAGAGPPSRLCKMSVQAVMDQFVAQCGLDEEQAARLAFEVHSNVEHYWAGDVSEMSSAVFDEEMYDGADLLFPQGYGQLIDAMAEDLDIRLAHTVTNITYGKSTVLVHTSQGMFSARFSIVTLPLGVLKADVVRFSPPLAISDPRKAQAIKHLGTAVYNKAILLFDEPFWDDSDVILRVPPSGQEGFRWSVFLNLHKVSGVPILVGFNLGASARAMERLSDSATTASAMQALRCVYDNVLEPKRSVITRWGNDPFSRMSYSYLPVGASLSDFDALRAPIAGTLFFAGEACSSAHFGTVHGAHITGVAAACDVLLAAASESVEARADLVGVVYDKAAAIDLQEVYVLPPLATPSA